MSAASFHLHPVPTLQGSAEQHAEQLASRLRAGALGWTVDPVTFEDQHTGFAVALPDHKIRTTLDDPDLAGKILTTVLAAFTTAHGYAGAWVHEGTVYLDVSQVVEHQHHAARLAHAHHQLAYFDLASGEEYPVKLAA